MGRRKLDEGRRVALSTRVSEGLAAEIDAVRGSLSRSAWLEQAARLVLSGEPHVIGTGRQGGKRAAVVVIEDEPPRPVVFDDRDLAAIGMYEESEPEAGPVRRGRCSHRNMRMAKGVCPDCREWVPAR